MKLRPLQAGLVLAIISCLAAGCGSDRSTARRVSYETNSQMQQASQAMAPSAGMDADAPKRLSSESADAYRPATTSINVNQPAGRKIIYTATVSLVINELDPLEKQLAALVRSSRGFVAGHSISGSTSEPREAVWRIRIPVGSFEGFLEKVKGLGELQSVDLSSEDVSDQYVDLDARIRTKEREEERLLRHLDRSTPRLEDILKVEGELSRVRGEIELAAGRLRQLKDQTDYTTITLTALEAREYKPTGRTTFGDRIVRQFSASGSAILLTGQAVVLFVVGLLPWTACLALLVMPFAAWWRRR